MLWYWPIEDHWEKQSRFYDHYDICIGYTPFGDNNIFLLKSIYHRFLITLQLDILSTVFKAYSELSVCLRFILCHRFGSSYSWLVPFTGCLLLHQSLKPCSSSLFNTHKWLLVSPFFSFFSITILQNELEGPVPTSEKKPCVYRVIFPQVWAQTR